MSKDIGKLVKHLIAPTIYNVLDDVSSIDVDTSSGGTTIINLQPINISEVRSRIFINDVSDNASIGNIIIVPSNGNLINGKSALVLAINGIGAEITISDRNNFIASLNNDTETDNANGWVSDDFVTNLPNTAGQSIVFTSSVASGGAVASTPTNLDVPDINSVVNKSRYGMQTVSVNAAANARSYMQQPTNTRFQIQPSTVIGFGADVCFNGGQIDFANDPVYQTVGFANAGATAPTQGAYIRPPYVGETPFYKCVLTYFDSLTSTPVRISFDSTVSYDPTTNRFLSIFVLIDAEKDSITYTIKQNGQTYEYTINEVLATYPDMWSGSIINCYIMSVARVGAPIVGAARSIVIDKVYRYIKPNYNY